MIDGLDRFSARARFQALGWLAIFAAGAMAQGQDIASLPSAPMPSNQPTSNQMLQLPFVVEKATADVLPLSLDDAIARGFDRNLQVKLSRENELTPLLNT